MMRGNKLTCLALTWLMVFSCSYAFGVQEKSKNKKAMPAGNPVLWQEPADIASRDLYLGAGGDSMKPDLTKVTFVKQKAGGYSTKYDVRDASGRRWIAKVGKEAQSETVANRLLWAVGYPTEIVYLAPRVTIEGKGTFDNVRFEARPDDVKRVGEWKWADNPFKGSQEFQGLKVMMLLINNWDIKDTNNQILEVRGANGETTLQYIISDLGGSFGKTGGVIRRSRNKPQDFVKAKFVGDVKGGRVDFNYGGKNKSLFEDITVAQAKWIGNLLSQLSDQQLNDAFRAANYGPEESQQLAQALRDRINQLVNIAG